MSRKRRNHSPDFKSRIAIVAIKSDQTLSELAGRYNINANLIVKWNIMTLVFTHSLPIAALRTIFLIGSFQHLS
jgi:transposase-like protein